MPSYNSSQFIGSSILSITEQSYPEWELLITDDHSSDDSCRVIEQYIKKDPRIKLFRLPQNRGAAVARNHSLEQAQGRYIAFCDSDDRWMPNKLERQLEFMRINNLEASYSSYIECDEANNNRGIMIARKRVTLNDMLRCDYMGFLTFMYDTIRLGKVPIPILPKRQDWALKLKIMQSVECAMGMMEPMAYYRVHRGSLSSNKLKLVRHNINVYYEVLNYSIFSSYLIFIFNFMPNYIVKRLRYKLSNV